MKRPDPVRDVEVTVSFRHGAYGQRCAYVSASLVRRSGQTSIAFSRHLSGSPERLVDLGVELVREQIIELWLTDEEPF